MKRLIAIVLSLMLLAACCLPAAAEQSGGASSLPDGQASGGDANSFGGSGGDAMPEMPEGQTPPGDFGDMDMSSFGGSDGGGFPGGAAVEGQLGSWSQGGKDANSLQGDDYAYDAALYVTASGIDMTKSAADRMAECTIDDSYAERPATAARPPPPQWMARSSPTAAC